MKTLTFTEWLETTSIKNIDLSMLTRQQFFLALEIAYNAGESNGINRLENTFRKEGEL